jgi:hypothetical protein
MCEFVIAKLHLQARDKKRTSTELTTKSVTTQKLNKGKKLGNQSHQLVYQKHSFTAPNGAKGRRRKDGNHSPKKIIQ